MIRSLLFGAAFYGVTALFLVFGSPLLLAPRSWAMAGLRPHAAHLGQDHRRHHRAL